MILAVLQLLISAPLKTVINFVFEQLISAATPNYVDKQIRGSHIGNESLGMRLSLGAAQVGKSLANIQVTGMLNDSKRNARSVRSTIIIQPELFQKRKNAIESFILRRNNTSSSLSESNIVSSNQSDSIEEIASRSYYHFITAFTKHRDSLDVTQRIQFDKNWSFIYQNRINVDTDSKSIQFSENIIMNEIFAVSESSDTLYKNTRNSPLSVAGAEFITQFLLDMLGRDTTEAKIFNRALQKDLKPVLVIPKYLKFFVIFLTLVTNAYFVLASILYGQNKPSGWQVNWATAFISNTVIDVVLNGLLEILILNYMIPISIAHSALQLKSKLDKLVDDISSNSKEVSESEFSMTDWFYVSSIAAKRRPDVPESSIVLKYRTASSSNISRKINSLVSDTTDYQGEVPIVESSNTFVKALILCGVFISLILRSLNIATSYVGGVPEVVQMILIRCIQPALLTCVVNFGVQYPQVWVCIVVLMTLVAYSLLGGSKISSSSKVSPVSQHCEGADASLVEERKEDLKIDYYLDTVKRKEIDSSSSSSSSSSSISTSGGSLTPVQTPPQDSTRGSSIAPPAATVVPQQDSTRRSSIARPAASVAPQQDSTRRSSIAPPAATVVPQQDSTRRSSIAPPALSADFSHFNNFNHMEYDSESSESSASNESDES